MGCRRSAKALECDLIVPVKWVRWECKFYSSSCISTWFWGEKKVCLFFPFLEKTLTTWSSYPDHCPCSWKPFASCGQPSYLLTDFCPLPLPTTANAIPFPSDFLICISTFTDFANFLTCKSQRNHSWLGLQNLLNQKSQLYIFKNL